MNKQRVVLVTGGSSGIGWATVKRFAQAGDRVILACRRQARAQQLCQTLEHAVDIVRCDVGKVADIRQMMDTIAQRYGKLDVLVNNAGISNTLSIEQIDEAEWDRMLDINLKGAFFCAQAAFAMMKRQGSGRMVHLASIAGERGGMYSGIHYSVSKGGILTMSKCLALSGAPYGITSNVVSPGVVETAMSREEGIPVDGIPLGRAAQPEEVAQLIEFLASDRAAYLTGVTLDANGGQYMP